MDNGSLEWDVGLLVCLPFPFKALFFHAEEGDNSNRKECKASLGLLRVWGFGVF